MIGDRKIPAEIDHILSSSGIEEEMYLPPALYTKERIMYDLHDLDYLGTRARSLQLYHQLSDRFQQLARLAGSKRFLTEYVNIYRLLDEYEGCMISSE